jgi:hypothetical protein
VLLFTLSKISRIRPIVEKTDQNPANINTNDSHAAASRVGSCSSSGAFAFGFAGEVCFQAFFFLSSSLEGRMREGARRERLATKCSFQPKKSAGLNPRPGWGGCEMELRSGQS